MNVNWNLSPSVNVRIYVSVNLSVNLSVNVNVDVSINKRVFHELKKAKTQDFCFALTHKSPQFLDTLTLMFKIKISPLRKQKYRNNIIINLSCR